MAVKPAETVSIACACEEEWAAAGPAQSLTQLHNGKTTAPHSTTLQPDTPLPRSADKRECVGGGGENHWVEVKYCMNKRRARCIGVFGFNGNLQVPCFHL